MHDSIFNGCPKYTTIMNACTPLESSKKSSLFMYLLWFMGCCLLISVAFIVTAGVLQWSEPKIEN